MHRASVWRGRLDTTTNWALVTSGGMLSFAFSAPDHSHVTLLLANFLALMFLTYEARRFRYFDVWRSRVRMLEENFFLPIIRRNLVSPRSDWREWVAEDLDQPKFKISLLEAIGMRLQRNTSGSSRFSTSHGSPSSTGTLTGRPASQRSSVGCPSVRSEAGRSSR